ncbi:DUF1353 domain-containing protein [Jannaschia aquimarina]|uniref:DUF1353 domain-containing protein n=1 Tax=Jannaschia aquimarina TaxID=935700 RepID=A0A0D1EIK6_9RHOB|nr:DUF1353 domain-containing protein [Jannaschia aquimarina]KIT17459.1 hypothetical protein jaqu_06470 [Jannaschia aquimarina]SNS75536.1 Protein of unknown function [Jannaschia aquimarina]
MSRYTDLHGWWVETDTGFRTIKPIFWEVGRKGSRLWVIVPIGYDFDVSIPVWARWLFDPRDPRYLKAAALHDWLLDDEWERVTAGGIFNRALRADGVGVLRRLAMTLAVVLFRFG